MTILTLDNVGLSNINTSTPTTYGIGLCYFDPSSETLKEFSSSTSIPVLPYEESIRRFYILKDSGTIIGNTVSLTVTTQSSDYVVKNTIAGLLDDDEFDTINPNNVSIAFLSEFSSGIIPVDIYIKSLTYSLTNVVLNIQLELT
jgi:hypothetical protein